MNSKVLGIPQKIRHDHIFQIQPSSMSTILIQRELEPGKKIAQNVLVTNIPQKSSHPYFQAEDFAGLSWIFLDNGDEI